MTSDVEAATRTAPGGLQLPVLIADNAALLIGTSTCAFCLEAERELAALGLYARILFVDQEKEPQLRSQVRKNLVHLHVTTMTTWCSREGLSLQSEACYTQGYKLFISLRDLRSHLLGSSSD
jgi:hypothetical protein